MDSSNYFVNPNTLKTNIDFTNEYQKINERGWIFDRSTLKKGDIVCVIGSKSLTENNYREIRWEMDQLGVVYKIDFQYLSNDNKLLTITIDVELPISNGSKFYLTNALKCVGAECYDIEMLMLDDGRSISFCYNIEGAFRRGNMAIAKTAVISGLKKEDFNARPKQQMDLGAVDDDIFEYITKRLLEDGDGYYNPLNMGGSNLKNFEDFEISRRFLGYQKLYYPHLYSKSDRLVPVIEYTVGISSHSAIVKEHAKASGETEKNVNMTNMQKPKGKNAGGGQTTGKYTTNALATHGPAESVYLDTNINSDGMNIPICSSCGFGHSVVRNSTTVKHAALLVK